jgi:cyclophilin family peptidyl-prolyl cis-trans isomerase
LPWKWQPAFSFWAVKALDRRRVAPQIGRVPGLKETMRLKALFGLFAGMFMASTLAAAQVPAGPPPLDPENTLLLDLSSGGRVAIQLRPDVAPAHVERMKTLARRGFYNGLTFHRVIEGFMAQGGDPKGDGTGGSDLPDLKAEFNYLPHVRGALAAARADAPDSANSQFYLMLVARLAMDGKYTVYGRVVSGMNFVDAITRGDPPADPTRILQASIASDNRPAPVSAPAPAPAVPVPAPAVGATTPQ